MASFLTSNLSTSNTKSSMYQTFASSLFYIRSFIFNSQESTSNISIKAKPKDGLGSGKSFLNLLSICKRINPLL